MRYTVLLLFCAWVATLSAQAQAQNDMLSTDSTWTKEVFYFPLSFAPDIPLEGAEEARFPKHWADTNSVENWSYVFVWNVQSDSALTERELEDNLQKYFNGLMAWEHTNALLVKTDDSAGVSKYTGKVRTLDAFFTKRKMTLRVRVETRYCRQQKRFVAFFRFSPLGFEHEVWHQLMAATLQLPECVP